jgi:hypothetical protein
MGKLRLISCRQLSERQCFRNARIQVILASKIFEILHSLRIGKCLLITHIDHLLADSMVGGGY